MLLKGNTYKRDNIYVRPYMKVLKEEKGMNSVRRLERYSFADDSDL